MNELKMKLNGTLADYYTGIQAKVPKKETEKRSKNRYASDKMRSILQTDYHDEELMKHLTIFICSILKVVPERLYEKNRQRSIVNARQICMYIIAKYCSNISYTEIGEHYKKDHTTVTFSVQTVNDLCDTNQEYTSQLQRIKLLVLEKFKK